MQDETVDTGPALVIPGHISSSMSNYVYEHDEEGYEQVLFAAEMVFNHLTPLLHSSNTPSNTP